MHEIDGHIEAAGKKETVTHAASTRGPITWSISTKADPEKPHDFEAMLLAIAGHDLRQPLQTIQSAHDLLGLGVRTKSELRQLRFGQTAIDSLKEQLDQLITALRFREHAKKARLTPVRVDSLLLQAYRKNAIAALNKGISVRAVMSRSLIMTDELLLGVVLRNLINNSVKYTPPGGRILLGCRQLGQSIRIDVYDTGIGIAGDQMPRIFEAFARLDFQRRDSLGIGLFIVRQAIGILGHRIEITSAPSEGSRFSIFASRAEGP